MPITSFIVHLGECGTCLVEDNNFANNSAAVPYFQRQIQTTRSCIAYDNCFYSVHVISVYEANYHNEFTMNEDHEPGSASVYINVDESEYDTRSFVLFLLSYEPIQWSLSIPQGVNFENIVVVSVLIIDSIDLHIVVASMEKPGHMSSYSIYIHLYEIAIAGNF